MKRFVSFAITATICGMISYDVSARESLDRPFRIGVLTLNRGMNNQKPLAQSDNAGYLLRGDVLIGGYSSNKVRAFDTKSRKNLWWLDVVGELTAPPLAIDNMAVFATRSGQILAVNMTTGEKSWETEVDAFIDRPMASSNGSIFVMSAGQVVYAIEAATGKKLWVHDAGFPDQVTVRRAPAPLVHDGRLILGLASGELLAVKIEDGKRLWKYNPFYQEARFKDVIGDMVVVNGKLLVTRYDGLIAMIDIGRDRQVIWQDRQTSVSTSAYRSGRYYVGLTNGDILAFDSSSGRIIWREQSGITPSFIVASESNLYVIGNAGRVLAMNSSSGEFLWGDNLGSRMGVPPIISGNRMYLATGLRNLYGYIIK